MDIPGIAITETDQKIFLQVQPDGARPAVDAAGLRSLLAASGAADCAVDETALAKAVEDCNTQKEPFSMQLAQRRDATIHIRIAEDDMLAEISVHKAQGGKAVTVGDLAQALAEAGVVFGIDDAALQQVAERNDCTSVPIARGGLPENGRDAVFKELVVHAANRAPKVNESGLIDYRERGSIDVVTPGMPLMRRYPPTPGMDGRTLRGRVLPARPGHDAPFAASLAGTQMSKDDPNLLEASVTGQPVLVSHGVIVEQVLQVAEVNMATGNIHFDGSVQVKGDVVQGMKLEASGDIVVAGMVDGGFLQAGGDIHVAGGVIAHATLIAGCAVSARFAQDVKIRAGTILSLADTALECELESLNQIVIGAQSHGRGRLFGGCATAMMQLSVPVLGSSKAGLTRVVMGVNAELTAQYAALERRLEQEKANEEALEKLIKQVTAAKDPKGMLPRIRASRQHAMQVWGQSLAEKKDLEQQIALALTARIDVGVGLEGAVDLVFGTHTARLRREFSAGTFSLDPTELVVMFSDRLGSRPVLG